MATLGSKIGPAIACGNVIIIKTSEKTPLSGLALAELIVQAGFPPGVIQFISGFGPTAGQAVIMHPEILKVGRFLAQFWDRVRMSDFVAFKVSFTGSGRTGRRLLEASAASNLKKVSLELGGKSPSIVFEVIDRRAGEAPTKTTH